MHFRFFHISHIPAIIHYLYITFALFNSGIIRSLFRTLMKLFPYNIPLKRKKKKTLPLNLFILISFKVYNLQPERKILVMSLTTNYKSLKNVYFIINMSHCIKANLGQRMLSTILLIRSSFAFSPYRGQGQENNIAD